MSFPRHGRHEHGQNFIHDRRVIDAIVDLVARTNGPIIEVGAGDGALTLPLQKLARPLTIEIDTRRAARLEKRTATSTRAVDADFLHYRLPRAPHIIVGNLPFHLTTAMLRRILHGPGLDRRRAAGAVGGRPAARSRGRRDDDDGPVAAVVRIHFGAKGFRVVVQAAAQRRRWPADDEPTGTTARRHR